MASVYKDAQPRWSCLVLRFTDLDLAMDFGRKVVRFMQRIAACGWEELQAAKPSVPGAPGITGGKHPESINPSRYPPHPGSYVELESLSDRSLGSEAVPTSKHPLNDEPPRSLESGPVPTPSGDATDCNNGIRPVDSDPCDPAPENRCLTAVDSILELPTPDGWTRQTTGAAGSFALHSSESETRNNLHESRVFGHGSSFFTLSRQSSMPQEADNGELQPYLDSLNYLSGIRNWRLFGFAHQWMERNSSDFHIRNPSLDRPELDRPHTSPV
ncbi:hypothetical protein BJX63DRAFT_140375 [Aspergillus granulosus]|uniref:Uncharacterized protein n=1 Tax=Aspergillus granulosus TaxID=176169 RepID=A0ABR4GTV0_9EURO